jgi:hypothetical protein
MLFPCLPALSLLQRSETVTDDARAASGPQRQRSMQPPPPSAAVPVRSSGRGSAPGSGVQLSPPVQASPFAASAAAAAAPVPSPFADPPPQTAALAEGRLLAGEQAGTGAALVSPFSSGALPAGLDFDARRHAAAAAAAAAEASRPGAEGGGV